MNSVHTTLVMQYFKASWSTTLHIVSWCSTLLFIVMSAIGSRVLIAHHAGVHAIWVIAVPLAVIAGCALYTVRGYSITPEAVLVHRLLWKTRISRAALESATIDPDALHWALRTWGNGGVFSFSGFFWTRRLGSFRAFVTNGRRCVVLRFPERTIVVSPDEPGKFIEALK